MKIIDGKLISAEIKALLKKRVTDLVASGKRAPGLVAILVGDNPASQSYVRGKKKICDEIGFYSEVVILPETTAESELKSIVRQYNTNDNIDGILVQLPLPKHINEEEIINTIAPEKDVDGFHPVNAGRLLQGNDCIYPCTPAGIVEMLKYYQIETSGKHVVVIGRSNIVGKPIAMMLAQKQKYANAIVTICHSAAADLASFTRQADILIAAIGQPEFVKDSMVKDGVVVIDVGINRVEDPNSAKGYRLVGDVDFDSVAPKASYITPVPGGVGLMTTALLMQNTFKIYLDRNL